MNLEPSEYEPQLLRELFGAAIELAEPERSRFFDEHCAGLPELRDALERLVRADLNADAYPLWQFPALHVEARHMAVEDKPPTERVLAVQDSAVHRIRRHGHRVPG